MCISGSMMEISLSFRGVGPQVAAEQPVSCKFFRLGKRRSFRYFAAPRLPKDPPIEGFEPV